ncbi:MAG: ribosome small subunit-dependent GTPase A, partial [Solirubrobacterales bacterium]
LTKADLAPDGDATAAQLRRRLGFDEALAISVRSGDGLPALRSLLAPEATTALLGTSGAGKSTLVNTLLGEERQATAPVREKDGLGRHTTVTRELIELPDGALLLDTPGLREVGLWVDAKAAFADVEQLATSCRFGDCAHRSEPGCAVREAIAPDRLAAWHRLAEGQARLDARRSR